MTPWRPALLTLSAVVGLAIAAPAEAGWQGTFQTTCWWKHGCGCGYGAAPAVAAYEPGCSSCYTPSCASCYTPPPCQTCETRYIARSYYQPVTSYQCRSYYEPCTSYRTSYYYEPCTTTRYSCYYDPCTCGYQTVAT